MSAPTVYAAINAITADFAASGIAKTHTNGDGDYQYRSIDDVLDRLAPLLAKHKLCIFPHVLERLVTERADEQDRLLLHVAVRVAFTLTSVDDGTFHTVEAYGEGLDAGDKATAKAMSAAFKLAMIQTFCIPILGSEDSDRTSHKLKSRCHSPEPLQGWRQWCLDIEDIVSVCESEQAISLVQERNRDLLKALAREQAALYAELGEVFVSRRELLARAGREEKPRGAGTKKQAKTSASPAAEVENA